jgi:hypothetical protein
LSTKNKKIFQFFKAYLYLVASKNWYSIDSELGEVFFMSPVKQFGTIIPFIEALKKVEDDELFFQPISQGKWSSAAIVAHLYFWDQYIQNNRLPLMLKLDDLPRSDVNVQDINNEAETFAHSGISKVELIDKFISNRKNLIDVLSLVDPQKSFSVGEHNLTIEKYFLDMAEHDDHHMKQMKAVYEKR